MISEWLSPQIRRAARSRRRGGWRSRQSLSGPSRSQLDPRHALVPEQEVQHLEALGAECARVVSGSTGVLMQDDSRARSEHQGFETSGKRAQERRCNAPKRQAATRAVGHARAVQQEAPSSLVGHPKSKVLSVKSKVLSVKSKVLSVKRSQSNQRPSEAICDHQRPSQVIRGYQRSSEAISVHQRPCTSEAIRGHLTCASSVVIRVISGHQWPSEAISPARHQWSSESSVVISGHQWPSHMRGVAWTKRKSPGSHPNMDTARPPVRASETVVTSSAAEASASIIIS